MSCVKSYTYPISASGGSGGFLGGLFFGGGHGGHTKYHISVNILGGDGRFKPVRLIADSVTGDSMIYWKEGNENVKYGSIEDLFLSYHDSVERDLFQVLSLENKNADKAKVAFKPISDVSYHGIKDVWKVTLRNGKTVEVTKDHSLMTAFNYKQEIKPRSFEDIKEKGAVISVDNYEFDLPKIPIDNNMLTFMGLWMADGSLDNLSSVRISTGGEQQILQWLENFSCLYNNGKSCLKYSQSRNGDVAIHRNGLALEIQQKFGNVDSYTKRVPEFIFTASNDQIAAFLKGYFSGDGSIHLCNNNPKNETFKYGAYYAVDCTSVNRKLLEDISVLLDRLGIKHNISTPFKQSKTGYKSDKLFYKLIIHAAPSVKKFVEKVGLIKKFEYKDRENYKRDKMLRPVSLRQIRSIEYIGKKPVYDIVEVKDTGKFVVNGICVSNTGNDITLLTKQTGSYLGFSPGIGTPLEVSGIRPGMVSHFEKIRTKIQLGDLQPIEAEIGFALEDGALQENLLGNKGILSSGRYEFHYDHDSLTILDRVNNCDMTTGQAMEKSRYSHINKNRDNDYWDYYFSRNFY